MRSAVDVARYDCVTNPVHITTPRSHELFIERVVGDAPAGNKGLDAINALQTPSTLQRDISNAGFFHRRIRTQANFGLSVDRIHEETARRRGLVVGELTLGLDYLHLSPMAEELQIHKPAVRCASLDENVHTLPRP